MQDRNQAKYFRSIWGEVPVTLSQKSATSSKGFPDLFIAKKMALPMKVFVYGTLLSGFSNHFLMENCKSLGAAITTEKFAFFIGDYPFVNSQIREAHITGELYEVNDTQSLEDLDALEQHPDWYVRTECEVELVESKELVSAQIYFLDKEDVNKAEKVPSGSFRDSPTSAKYLVTAEVLVN